MKVTLATLKDNVRKNSHLVAVSGKESDLIVSQFCREVYEALAGGNTVSLYGLMTIEVYMRKGKLRYNVHKQEVDKSKDRLAARLVLARELNAEMGKIRLPKKKDTSRGKKVQVSKD